MTAAGIIWMLLAQGLWAATAGASNGAVPARPPGHGSDPAPGDGNITQMADIHDIKPVLEIGHDWLWAAYLAVGVGALVGLLLLARWLWNRRKEPPTRISAPPPIPPDKEAYAALDALAADKTLAPKQFYFQLSAVLRRYIERRFHFPAAEMTTEELLPQVNRISLDPSLALELKGFCRQTDPIKFAGAAARQDRLARYLAFTRNFVRETTETQEHIENQNNHKAKKNMENREIAARS
jgi:hypothetical protein